MTKHQSATNERQKDWDCSRGKEKNLISTYSNGDTFEIPLYSKKGEFKGVLIADKEARELVESTTWRVTHFGYVIGYINRKKVLFHRAVMGATKGLVVDHINHNKLDNRKSNLRVCTNQENTRNRKVQHGVYWRKDKNKWCAVLTHNYKKVYLGHYEHYDDALQARKEAEKVY